MPKRYRTSIRAWPPEPKFTVEAVVFSSIPRNGKNRQDAEIQDHDFAGSFNSIQLDLGTIINVFILAAQYSMMLTSNMDISDHLMFYSCAPPPVSGPYAGAPLLAPAAFFNNLIFRGFKTSISLQQQCLSYCWVRFASIADLVRSQSVQSVVLAHDKQHDEYHLR